MSAQRSKPISGSIWRGIGRAMAWIGSFFLWFITPTGAAELWEKWIREKEEEESQASPQNESKKDHLDKT